MAPFFRQEGAELPPHHPHRPVEKALPALGVGGEVHREVASHGLSQGLGAPVIQDFHPGDGVAFLLGCLGPDAGEAGGLPGAFLPKLPGLQGQVGTFVGHFRISSHKILWSRAYLL